MNPFFNAMGGNKQPNMMQSGKITQDQYNQARQQAQQMQGMFEGMRGMFGK